MINITTDLINIADRAWHSKIILNQAAAYTILALVCEISPRAQLE